ncbi:MAG: hypothetical protein ACKVOE_06485 [Rickettsiales bacterium]
MDSQFPKPVSGMGPVSSAQAVATVMPRSESPTGALTSTELKAIQLAPDTVQTKITELIALGLPTAELADNVRKIMAEHLPAEQGQFAPQVQQMQVQAQPLASVYQPTPAVGIMAAPPASELAPAVYQPAPAVIVAPVDAPVTITRANYSGVKPVESMDSPYYGTGVVRHAPKTQLGVEDLGPTTAAMAARPNGFIPTDVPNVKGPSREVGRTGVA